MVAKSVDLTLVEKCYMNANKKKLLESFLDHKCPWHNKELDDNSKILFCNVVVTTGQYCCGIWDNHRVNTILGRIKIQGSAYKRLLKIKEYYEKLA
jgi:hypothetical protein